MNQSPPEILERIRDAFVALDPQGRCTYLSQQAGELFGCPAASLIGKTIWDRYPGGDDQPFARACQQAMRDQVPVQIEDYHAAWDRWLQSRIYPSTEGVSVFLTDVSDRKRAEASLRESEQRLTLALSVSGHGLWDWSVETGEVHLSAAWADMIGVEASRPSQVFAAFVDRLHPEDRDRVLAALRGHLEGRTSTYQSEFRLRHQDGRWLWVLDRGRIVERDADGRPVRALGILTDITDRKESEQRLRDSEERYRLVMGATNEVIWDFDVARKRIHWGESLATTFGHERAGTATDLDWWTECIHPEDRARVLGSLRASLEQGETRWSEEYRFRRGDGAYAIVRDRGLVRRDEAGRPVRMVGSIQDLTDKREAETELHALFAAMRDVILVIDRDGRYRKVAPTSPDLLLRLPDELIGRTFHEVLPREQADLFLRSLRSSLQSGRTVDLEYGLKTSAGRDAWFTATVSPLTHETVLWVARDVTEQRRSMEALRASERRYREIFVQSRDTIYVRGMDGTLVDVNPAAEEVFGAPREELLKHPVQHFYADPSDREALEREVAARGAVRNYGIRLRRLDGGEFDATVSTTMLRSDDGELVGFQGTIQDVTARKEAEEALQRSEAWFRSLTQNALDIITVVDAEGRIRYSTPSGARTLGYQEGELRRRRLLDLIHPEDQPEVRAALERLVSGGTEPVVLSTRVRAQDGSWQLHQAVAQSLLHDPAVRGVVINSRDMTEQWTLESQLRQAQKMEAVGRLAGGVAHDFNNVLMAITGFAALLEGEISPGADAAQYLAEIHRSAERAASLTRQLLAFGRKQALRPKVVNLNAVVEGSGAMLRRLIREDVQLVHRLDSRLGQCRVDPHQVEQVLVNLVVNATDALPEGGIIEIVTRNHTVTARDRRIHPYVQPGSYTALTVRDTGQGMDAETLAKIFEPFFTTKEVGKGTGLGLSTVYGIVKQSGGYITVESRPAVGSTFTVLLPRIAEEEEQSPAAAPARPLPRGSGTVLLAEDEDAVRLLSRLALQKAGYQVLEARDGQEALRLVQEHPGSIDLLITDVIMPRLGGYALARALREQWPGLRVIFMSGYTGDSLREAGLDAVDGEFLPKPVTPETLTLKVQEVLSVRG